MTSAAPDSQSEAEFVDSSRSTMLPLRARSRTSSVHIATKGDASSLSSSAEFRCRGSSIGDVEILRTKLQKRRTQISKQLSVEDVGQASFKLGIKSTNVDKQAKAPLDAPMSNTQVQMLQAELARINSSLQAYQQEMVRDTQVPIIPIPTKTTDDVQNFAMNFSKIAKSHYHLVDTAEVSKAGMKLQDMRKKIASVPRDQLGIQQLYDYRNQIRLVGIRFLHPRFEHTVKFSWFDAISGVHAMQNSVAYERACVLFNIAALHTQIAAYQDRSTVDGTDTTIQELEKAIALLEHLKANNSSSPTMDMSQEIIALLIDIMTAQAVEMQWEKKMLMELDEEDIQTLILFAQHAKAIAECYKPIRELVEEPALKEYFPASWCALMKIKDSHYKALAHYYAAIVHHKLAIMCRKDQNTDLKSLQASIATELCLFYTSESTNTEELFVPSALNQMGLVKTHLNCASLLHEYALRFRRSCRDLVLVESLKKVLEEAKQRTEKKKLSILGFYSAAMIAPVIQPAAVDIHPKVPPSSERLRMADLFEFLGPIPAFSADNVWSEEKEVTITKDQRGFGFSLKGFKPAIVGEVDKAGPAKALQVNDWILKINDKDVRFFPHEEVVKCVKESSNTVKLVVVTPMPLPRAQS